MNDCAASTISDLLNGLFLSPVEQYKQAYVKWAFLNKSVTWLQNKILWSWSNSKILCRNSEYFACICTAVLPWIDLRFTASADWTLRSGFYTFAYRRLVCLVVGSASGHVRRDTWGLCVEASEDRLGICWGKQLIFMTVVIVDPVSPEVNNPLLYSKHKADGKRDTGWFFNLKMVAFTWRQKFSAT